MKGRRELLLQLHERVQQLQSYIRYNSPAQNPKDAYDIRAWQEEIELIQKQIAAIETTISEVEKPITVSDLELNLENFNMVRARMKQEGFDYCFRNYSSFNEIEDENFHKLRLAYIEAANSLERYVFFMMDDLQEKIDNFKE
jgi:hypothetical protein